MNRIIKEHWYDKKRELPGQDCIVYPDGRITILDCYKLYNPNNEETQYFCRPICDTTIESMEKYDSAYWTIADEWVDSSVDYEGGRIYGCSGGMGNEGYIVCTDGTESLKWAISFNQYNPIKKVSVKDTILIAINEHSDMRIEINLDNLTDIKVVPTAVYTRK